MSTYLAAVIPLSGAHSITRAVGPIYLPQIPIIDSFTHIYIHIYICKVRVAEKSCVARQLNYSFPRIRIVIVNPLAVLAFCSSDCGSEQQFFEILSFFNIGQNGEKTLAKEMSSTLLEKDLV